MSKIPGILRFAGSLLLGFAFVALIFYPATYEFRHAGRCVTGRHNLDDGDRGYGYVRSAMWSWQGFTTGHSWICYELEWHFPPRKPLEIAVPGQERSILVFPDDSPRTCYLWLEDAVFIPDPRKPS